MGDRETRGAAVARVLGEKGMLRIAMLVTVIRSYLLYILVMFAPVDY